jgi:hypothetical protein
MMINLPGDPLAPFSPPGQRVAVKRQSPADRPSSRPLLARATTSNPRVGRRGKTLIRTQQVAW